MKRAILAKQLKKKINGKVFFDEPMSRHTSFRIGGPADVLVVPKDIPDLLLLVEILSDVKVPFHVIGAGTNLLVKDEGIRGVVIKIQNTIDHIKDLGNGKLRCGAGALLTSVCKTATLKGLSGLEFASGIPGTVGGAVTMNAAAFGGFMSNLVDVAEVVTYDGYKVRLNMETLEPGIKTTRILNEPLILVEVDFTLKKDDPLEIQNRINEYLKERKDRQPLNTPNAGCMFKNPDGEGAGRYIDQAGLKGISAGGAKISCLHANFIINNGNATAKDVISLMKHIQEVVYSKFQIMLEPEVKILGG